MDGPAANSSRTDDDKDDIEEFLGILEANFKGRKCYIGQYGLRTKGGPSFSPWSCVVHIVEAEAHDDL